MKNPLYAYTAASGTEKSNQLELSQEGQLLYKMVEFAHDSSERRTEVLTGETYHVSQVGKVTGGRLRQSEILLKMPNSICFCNER